MAGERDPIPCPVCREVIIGPLSAAVHLSDMHGLSMYGALARLTRELEEARERERALREALMTISMRCHEAVMQTPLLEHQSMHALAGACKQDADAALAGQSALTEGGT